MTLTQKQRIIPIVVATLCILIGVMTMLFVVYYVNAINNQNQSRSQLATLQAQNADLQNLITARDSQISTLNNQLSSLNAQLNTLTTDKQNLQDQVNRLSDTVDSLTQQIAQLNAALGLTGTGSGGGRAHFQ